MTYMFYDSETYECSRQSLAPTVNKAAVIKLLLQVISS